MAAKKIFAAFACAAAIALALAFGLFPFCEHKINWDFVAGKTAEIAADAGCDEIAADLAGSIKYRQFSAKSNAHMALMLRGKFGEIEAKNFIRTCGKYFDFEEYEARLMMGEIAKEPDFASGFFKIKYMPRIRALKNPYLKALLYYSLALRTKNGDSEMCAKAAFDILKSQPGCENKERAFIEISQMALENKRYADIVEASKLCPAKANYYASFFGFLKDGEFYKYSDNRKEELLLRRAISFHQKQKKTKDPLNSGDVLRYSALRLGYNPSKSSAIRGSERDILGYRDFNAPLFAYILFTMGENGAFETCKQYALSKENIKRNQNSEFGYFSAAATLFAAMGDFASSYEILGKVKEPHKRLKILNSVAPHLKGDRRAIEDFANYLKSAK